MTRSNEYADRVLSRQMRSLHAPQRAALAADVLAGLGDQFNPDIADLLVSELKGPGVAMPEVLPDTANAAFVKAHLATDNVDAAAAWERFLTLYAKRDPMHLLAYARALAGSGRNEEAVIQLRLAMSQPVRYPFFPRCEKLVQQLAGTVTSNVRQCRMAILGSSTITLLAPVLQALCLRDRIQAEVYQGLYGAIEQEVLDPNSGLANFRPDIVLLVMNWRDLQLPAVSASETDVVNRVISERKQLWQRLSDTTGCHVIQPAFDFPAEESYGYLGASLRGGRTRIIELINFRMREEAPVWVSILDIPSVQRATGSKRWEDTMAWASYKQHPATEVLPELAEAQMSHIRAVLGLTRKVLVTDLDNTLWRGVIGEDGLEGIGIGPGTPAGEAHLQLQHYLLDLKSRGILLAVCSKNNPDDAKLPFEQHAHMALKLEDFAGFRANWDDKVSNLRALAEDLSLGLDSFVFLDDNPLEREWVRSQLPQVTVVELGSSVYHYVRDLDRGQYFQTLTLSAEDLSRAEQYRIEAQREGLRSSAGSLDDFLGQLQLQASVELVTGKNLTRVTQLVNKTNQFNTTTRRYTEAQVRAIAEDPLGWAGAFHMSDRMGSYGLIGVLFCRASGSPACWEIDTWLMSCRTLGRQMERYMFDRMLDAAIRHDIQHITGVFRPTAKNILVKELFDQLGFDRASESAEEVRYEMKVPANPATTATHVRDVSVAAEAAGS